MPLAFLNDPTGHSPLSKIKSAARKAVQKASSLVKKGADLVVKGAKAAALAVKTGVKADKALNILGE